MKLMITKSTGKFSIFTICKLYLLVFLQWPAPCT